MRGQNPQPLADEGHGNGLHGEGTGGVAHEYGHDAPAHRPPRAQGGSAFSPPPDPLPALKVEKSFSTFFAPHFGQAGADSESRRCRCSNVLLHAEQRYSYMGIGPLCFLQKDIIPRNRIPGKRQTVAAATKTAARELRTARFPSDGGKRCHPSRAGIGLHPGRDGIHRVCEGYRPIQ